MLYMSPVWQEQKIWEGIVNWVQAILQSYDTPIQCRGWIFPSFHPGPFFVIQFSFQAHEVGCEDIVLDAVFPIICCKRRTGQVNGFIYPSPTASLKSPITLYSPPSQDMVSLAKKSDRTTMPLQSAGDEGRLLQSCSVWIKVVLPIKQCIGLVHKWWYHCHTNDGALLFVRSQIIRP